MLDDFVEHFACGVAFDQHLDTNRLKAHLRRLHLRAAGTPCRRVADVAFEKQFKLGELHLLPRRHGGDAHRETPAQRGQHDFARCGRGVLAEQVQGFVHHHWMVIGHITERAILALHHGMYFVGAALGGIFAAGVGEFQQPIAVDGAQVGLYGMGG